MQIDEARALFKSLYGRNPTSTEVRAMLKMYGYAIEEDTSANEVNVVSESAEGDWREIMTREFF